MELHHSWDCSSITVLPFKLLYPTLGIVYCELRLMFSCSRESQFIDDVFHWELHKLCVHILTVCQKYLQVAEFTNKTGVCILLDTLSVFILTVNFLHRSTVTMTVGCCWVTGQKTTGVESTLQSGPAVERFWSGGLSPAAVQSNTDSAGSLLASCAQVLYDRASDCSVWCK